MGSSRCEILPGPDVHLIVTQSLRYGPEILDHWLETGQLLVVKRKLQCARQVAQLRHCQLLHSRTVFSIAAAA